MLNSNGLQHPYRPRTRPEPQTLQKRIIKRSPRACAFPKVGLELDVSEVACITRVIATQLGKDSSHKFDWGFRFMR